MHHVGTSSSGTRSAVPGAAGSAAAASAASAAGPHIEMYERVRKEGNSGSELAPSSPLLPDAEKSDELGYGHNGHGNAEEEEHLAGHWRTFINTTMAFIGAGILGLPSSFKTGGLWLSLGTLAVAGVGSMYCMWLLVLCRRLLASQGATSYSDVCRIALGTPGMVVVEFSLIVTQASFSIAYILFIARNFEQITGIAQPLVVAMCMPLLFALCLFRHAKYLAPFAMLAEAVNLVGMAVVLTTDVKTMNVNHPDVVQANWPALPFITGVFLYCFEGMGMVLSLEANALHKQSFVPILTAVVTLYAVLCAAMGAMGYLAYGAATRDIVLLNMGNTPFTLVVKHIQPSDIVLLNMGNTPFTLVVKVSFCIGLYFTYPRESTLLRLGLRSCCQRHFETTSWCRVGVRVRIAPLLPAPL
eukprot:TRINITY_DN2400_c0_g1_i4.p1 TRINITY_DN2400_c0_g1~~TRINITY_DN2400_c0_g1_i4.p1  ORF type:complete len:414 (+),score=100.61 TRINITY_DN2400_c0_g1_i4:451-1692(+)